MKRTRTYASSVSKSTFVLAAADPTQKIKELGSTLFFSLKKLFTKSAGDSSSTGSSFRNVGNRKNMKKLIPAGILVILVGFALVRVAGSLNKATAPSTDSGDQRIEVKGAKASMVLSKEYAFPLKDAKGKEVTKIKVSIQDAELRDEIIVKGSRAVAVKGRTFLILNIKIVNDYEKPIDINVKDYIRLATNGNDKELLAADIHNDPVTIQAISTKYTRIGFPINDTDTNLTLYVGEIKGDKEAVPLNLQ